MAREIVADGAFDLDGTESATSPAEIEAEDSDELAD